MSAPVVGTLEKDLTKYAAAINALGQGRSNAVGTVTLRASQTTTTVAAQNCGAGNAVFLFPKTANAAAVAAATYVSSVSAGEFVITHTSNSNTDKTFSWVALG